MKRASLVFLIAAVTVGTIGAFERPDFDKIVDFSLTLKDIVSLVKNPNFNPDKIGKVLVFDGSVSTITVVDKNPASFSAELVVVDGEWKGTEDVLIYQSFVYAEGPDFAKRLPERKPKNPGPELISQNDHVLVVGRIADVFVDEKGNRFPVILAYYIRVMQ